MKYRVIKGRFGWMVQGLFSKTIKRWYWRNKTIQQWELLNGNGNRIVSCVQKSSRYKSRFGKLNTSNIPHVPFKLEREAKEWMNQLIKKKGSHGN